MARKIADTKKMTHDEWVALRKSSIGGSDAATCVNMNTYSSLLTLYADKKGLSKEREDSEAMRLGRDLEQYVAERFTEKTGKKVRNDFFMYADDDYDFITANIDRRVVGENAGLECKTMGGSFGGYNLAAGEIPGHYFCQCQHYMMVMGFDMVYLAILVLQRGLYVIEVKRDDEFIKSLREAETAFWTNYIMQDKMPEPDGSEASLDTLNEIYPSEVRDTEISIYGLDQMVSDYKAYKQIKDEYHMKAEQVKAKICAQLGSNEIGIGKAVSCSWKTQGRENISPKKLKAKYPAIYNELVDTTKYRVFRIKNAKKEK